MMIRNVDIGDLFLLVTLQTVCSTVNVATGKRKERLKILQNKLLFLPAV
jgi:hypothetical protein